MKLKNLVPCYRNRELSEANLLRVGKFNFVHMDGMRNLRGNIGLADFKVSSCGGFFIGDGKVMVFDGNHRLYWLLRLALAGTDGWSMESLVRVISF